MPPVPQSTGSYGRSERETTNEISGVGTPGTYNSDSAESYAMSWTSQDDELASALEGCVSAFRSGLQQLQDISFEDLVFCEPQKDTDLTIPPGDVANDSYYESTRLKQNSVIKLS